MHLWATVPSPVRAAIDALPVPELVRLCNFDTLNTISTSLTEKTLGPR